MYRFNDLPFDNHFARLPDGFHSRVEPTPLKSPQLIAFNPRAAALIGLNHRDSDNDALAAIMGGVRPWPGSEPVAMAYSGHQFGHYVPQLGDGRAILLGEVATDHGGWELQLKGAGRTPYSRNGDGRAVLRSTIREYLCSEAMAGLGIPTTRALCMATSEEEVHRERLETGATLLRMAPTHIRFGSFEYFYYRGEFDRLRALADYVIERYYPTLAERHDRYRALLGEVVERTAQMIAKWQLVGFAHGVMNTDNMSILGLTLDYGPFGFLDHYDPAHVCNHSDYQGRYAFDQQPEIGLWNLSCLAQSLLPLLDPEDGEAAVAEARSELERYQPHYEEAFNNGMRTKLGLLDPLPGDQELASALLTMMADGGVDYTLLFRSLGALQHANRSSDRPLQELFPDRVAFDRWACRYRQRLNSGGEATRNDHLRRERMEQVNPRFILRNYLAQSAIDAAEQGDFREIERLQELLAHPYAEQPEMAHYAAEPPDWGRRLAVSCSS